MNRWYPRITVMTLVMASLALQGEPSSSRIPAVKVESLAGASIALPEALRGKVGILVIGFSRGAQRPVTDWGRRLAADYQDSPTVLYYEMPMLAAVPRLVRGLVLREMRSSVPEPAWPRFAPLTEDEKSWRSIAHYAAEDDAYVLLVDSQGVVRWRTSGPATDIAYTALKQQVGAAISQTATAERP